MKKETILFAMLTTLVMLAAAAASLFYLPAQIAVQWNENGISNTASKYIVFVFPALNAVFLALHSQGRKTGRKMRTGIRKLKRPSGQVFCRPAVPPPAVGSAYRL